ncbi:MAG: ABC-2 transporter permease [Oscillospiraceae bacterium]|nr:ABC-2 transporter permease [Oscillospiraceae bacterium]
MKGLLLKDFYVTLKRCKFYLIVSAFFIAASFFLDNWFSDGYMFMMLPVVIFAVLPINLLAFDEKSAWTKYSRTLPYSKAQIVSAKYIFGFTFQVVMALVVLLALAIRAKTIGGFDELSQSAQVLCGVFILSLIVPAVGLPLCFKFGTEKGRVFFMALVFGLALAFSFSIDEFKRDLRSNGCIFVMIAIVAAFYVGSWIISIAVYNQRETIK